MEETQINMNNAKTELIVIGILCNLKKNMVDSIEIGKIKIHQTPKIKFLGVYLYELLNLKDHIWNGGKKANYSLMLIHNICKNINIDTTRMLPCTLVLSQWTMSVPCCLWHHQQQANHIKQCRTSELD